MLFAYIAMLGKQVSEAAQLSFTRGYQLHTMRLPVDIIKKASYTNFHGMLYSVSWMLLSWSFHESKPM